MKKERIVEEILWKLEMDGSISKGLLFFEIPAGAEEIEETIEELKEEGVIEEKNGKLKIIR